MKIYWVLVPLALFAGCLETDASTTPIVAEEQRENVVFDGLIVATNATKLHAPQNTFRIGGWNSSSSWIELKDTPDDGTEVKKGDVVGKFKFRGQEARPRVESKIAAAEAERDQANVSDTGTKATLEANVGKSLLDAKSAELDLLKGDTVSKRDLAKYEITKQLAEFDADANQKYSKAEDRAQYADRGFHELTVARAQADMDRFNMYKERFSVLAPHDGIVRHGYHRRRNRKVQKGDGMPAGMHFASVARDTSVAVDIYVPERFYKLTKEAKTFLIKSPTSDEAHLAKVESVEEFPQTVGFVKEDNRIPNAQDRVYVVRAVFESMPKEMSSGLEVKVEIP